MDIHHAWCYTVGVVIETWESESEMKRQHTPGPWRIGDAGNTVFGPKTDRPSPQTIATLSVIDHEANGRLIAAAPELLSAAKFQQAHDEGEPWAVEDAERMVIDNEGRDYRNAAQLFMFLRRAAILRAEGSK